MKRMTMKLIVTVMAAGALSAGTMAFAQQGRDPAYAAARSAGQVGEQVDGYLGTVGSQSAAIQAVVKDINLQRKKYYTEQAAGGGTVVERAFVAGCNAIAKTVPGEKYQAPDGSWLTRTSAAPVRDARCV